ncbi:DNA-binding protein [Mesorhizobium sp. M7A.F.Ca.MR.176.00.0.0]|uniref:DNA-binding protein n=1 Tax=Mesorhizobium sp. M7A.F.Ca.MR.176.00.0.0 TaxID=2496776 RepID=UPI000FD247C3|nr:DNA-binding protein [Mesorhizobium sp. M7A.F.Ca.MR.176.00.0.0]RUU93327.1 DNA-binding protein [Mesorhizobium sp. M7A.F.Ca.MR.176.00.0.0]
MSDREVAPLDLVWGIEGIAKLIGRTERQAYHMLTTGALPAKQVGNRWVIEKSKLIKFFMDDAA